MNARIFVLLTLFTMSFQSAFGSDPDFKVSMNQQSCGEDYLGKETILDIKRTEAASIILNVASGFTCGLSASNPSVYVSRGNMTLSVSSHSQGGVSAACICKINMTIEIGMPDDYSEYAKTLYYVQDGLVLGHAMIPNQSMQRNANASAD